MARQARKKPATVAATPPAIEWQPHEEAVLRRALVFSMTAEAIRANWLLPGRSVDEIQAGLEAFRAA